MEFDYHTYIMPSSLVHFHKGETSTKKVVVQHKMFIRVTQFILNKSLSKILSTQFSIVQKIFCAVWCDTASSRFFRLGQIVGPFVVVEFVVWELSTVLRKVQAQNISHLASILEVFFNIAWIG